MSNSWVVPKGEQMNIRLIKRDLSPVKRKTQDNRVPKEGQLTETIRSWVDDFRSGKANRIRLDLRRMNN
jgi:hypothetical protein